MTYKIECAADSKYGKLESVQLFKYLNKNHYKKLRNAVQPRQCYTKSTPNTSKYFVNTVTNNSQKALSRLTMIQQ